MAKVIQEELSENHIDINGRKADEYAMFTDCKTQ